MLALPLNRVGMVLADDGKYVRAPIHNESEHIENIAAQNAHFERIHLSAGGELAAKDGFPAIVTGEPELSLDYDRFSDTAKSSDWDARWKMRQKGVLECAGANHRSISARIDQEL